MYYSPLTSDYLYSIETQYLRANPKGDTLSTKHAFENVKNLGQRGGNPNGFSADSVGNICMLMPSQNAIYIYKYTYFPSLFLSLPPVITPSSPFQAH